MKAHIKLANMILCLLETIFFTLGVVGGGVDGTRKGMSQKTLLWNVSIFTCFLTYPRPAKCSNNFVIEFPPLVIMLDDVLFSLLFLSFFPFFKFFHFYSLSLFSLIFFFFFLLSSLTFHKKAADLVRRTYRRRSDLSPFTRNGLRMYFCRIAHQRGTSSTEKIR